MTRFAVMGLVLAGGLSGCMPSNFLAPDKAPEKAVEAKPSITRPPVVAAQINPTNAQEKAQALREELERDMERAIEANDPKPEKK